MSQNEKLKILVTQRYSWDTFWYEELLNKTKKELQESSKKEVEKPTDSKQENKMLIQAEKEYKEALAYVKDMISPAFMKIMPDKLKINNVFVIASTINIVISLFTGVIDIYCKRKMEQPRGAVSEYCRWRDLRAT